MKADHAQVNRLLKTARGQIDGILKMVEEDSYCLEVSSQIMAAQSILKKANRMILRAHMDCCVREAAASGDPGPKLEELAALLDKLAELKNRPIGRFLFDFLLQVPKQGVIKEIGYCYA